jgi:phospholipid/cholesterol/gamma-HCH transport system substrate-binding protein
MGGSGLRDTIVGIFVLGGLGAIAYLSVALGGATYRGPGGLQLHAVFDEIGGLKPRSQVVVGGVKVGQVIAIRLDDDLRPEIIMDVDEKLELPTDTSASILTSGVLGDQYIALEPGGEEELLESGSYIEFTQNAVVLERFIGRLVQSLAGGGSE